MGSVIDKVQQSPTALRVVPFVVFVAPLYLQDLFGVQAPYWMYALRTLLGVGLVAWMLPLVKEMRWALSWEAVLVGILVFGLWVGLDPWYPAMGRKAGGGWNPHEVFGAGSALAWTFLMVRLLGSTLVVPPLEEVFYRSFVYRYLVRSDFQSVALSAWHWRAFVGTSVVFGFVHHEWLAGMLCGAAYQGLVLRKGRLGDAITAHAITNGLLGLWVMSRGAWQFW